MMSYGQILDATKPGQPVTVTLEAGYGYKVGEDFWRLTADVVAVVKGVMGDSLFVQLPKDCKFAEKGNARVPLRAVKSAGEVKL